MLTTQTFDVAVIGGGMVGLATAIGLAMENMRVVLIDAGEVQAVTAAPMLRVSAINQASQRLLTHLGTWQHLTRISPYQKMQVWCENSLSKIDFDAHSLAMPHLGCIIENEAISYALSQSAAELSWLNHIENTKVTHIAFGEREAWLTLDNGDNLSAALVVAADGANSWVRSQCHIPMSFWDYGHHGLVATIRTEHPHQSTARQVFTETGPLAFLPLADPYLCSIVWSLPPERSGALLECDKVQFERSLTAEFNAKLGLCQLESERQAFPLRMRYARHFARHRLLLAGDAAHTIHPLAGQGVNLGFLDAASIAQVVGELYRDHKDIGQYRHLRALERWRKADAMEMITAMEVFKRLFDGRNPIKKAIRDLGLSLVDHFSPLKTLFIQQALGNKSGLPKHCQFAAQEKDKVQNIN
ncbi:FAD-dependent monooxygenase [Shewanella surugensis]|uniref:FAD-dependent monooxygenase n=1 Tax=Shewanella surugensis TaxID=212020 RepID=A0ABT0LA10_9GAMM|nr:FAD-dependent monooxygenase [Shewanella surugensis]MCL1124320.1 FAD-dependent monooxygenase [Shewanella surugensis]